MSKVNDVIVDLKELASLLRNYNVVSHTGPIDDVVSQLQMWNSNSGKRKLQYKLRGLEFICKHTQFIRGSTWNDSLTLKLDADLIVEKKEFVYDDVNELTINIEYGATGVDGTPCKGAWHLDYHGDTKQTRFMHPVYHFHHGGKKLDDLPSYGNLVLIDTPRVMHHPLDLFLAVDFVVSNFIELDDWNSLRNDTRYKKLMEKFQLCWWAPFYTELGNFWDSKKSSKAKASQLNIAASKRLNPHLL